MLHTIRTVINDDEKWRDVLRGLNKTFYHQTVTTAQIEKYMSSISGHDLSKIFDQYLRDVRIPELVYSIKGNQLKYRWSKTVNGFNMPINVYINEKATLLQPSSQWKTIILPKNEATVKVDRNYYVTSKQL